jgi:hypothetical protein
MDQDSTSRGGLSSKEPKVNPITVFIALGCVAIGAILVTTGHLLPGAVFGLFAIVTASAPKMANTWQKFVILRAGKLRQGAGTVPDHSGGRRDFACRPANMTQS